MVFFCIFIEFTSIWVALWEPFRSDLFVLSGTCRDIAKSQKAARRLRESTSTDGGSEIVPKSMKKTHQKRDAKLERKTIPKLIQNGCQTEPKLNKSNKEGQEVTKSGPPQRWPPTLRAKMTKKQETLERWSQTQVDFLREKGGPKWSRPPLIGPPRWPRCRWGSLKDQRY